MRYRMLGKTGFKVSEVSLGTWQIGGKWGEPFSDKNAEETLNRVIDLGVNFIDTADLYSEGLSEVAVARVVKSRKEEVFIATKCGRKIQPHTAEGYTPEKLVEFVEDSLKNMQLETIDLIQLHCPPTEVYYRPEIFEVFDRRKHQGKIRNLGVSVEKVEEALKAIEYSNVTTVQIIFNMFRHRPSELFFSQAKKKNIGVIARVPLASGLLSGKMKSNSTFNKNDHRAFNRNGEIFDKGETFSGVNFELGLKSVEKLKKIFPGQKPLAAWAIRWILMFPEVSCVIPGASSVQQAEANIKASDLVPLTTKRLDRVKAIYEKYIKPQVHHMW